jgi:hypothetical protein
MFEIYKNRVTYVAVMKIGLNEVPRLLVGLLKMQ